MDKNKAKKGKQKVNYGRLCGLTIAADRWERRLFRASNELQKLRRQISYQRKKIDAYLESLNGKSDVSPLEVRAARRAFEKGYEVK